MGRTKRRSYRANNPLQVLNRVSATQFEDTYHAGTPRDVQRGRAYTHNGTSFIANVTANRAINGNFRVSGNFKIAPDQVGNTGIFSADANGNRQWQLSLSIGRPNFLVFNQAVQTQAISITEDVNDDEWHHLEGEVDKTNSRLKIYLDGVLRGDNELTVIPDFTAAPTFTFQHFSTSATRLTGSAYGCKVVDETGTLGFYKLDEGSGAIAYDSSGNQNHGTITNAVTVPIEEDPNSIHQFQNQFSYQNLYGYTKVLPLEINFSGAPEGTVWTQNEIDNIFTCTSSTQVVRRGEFALFDSMNNQIPVNTVVRIKGNISREMTFNSLVVPSGSFDIEITTVAGGLVVVTWFSGALPQSITFTEVTTISEPFIPRNESITLPPFEDIFGNSLQFQGHVPNNSNWVNSAAFQGNGVASINLGSIISAIQQERFEIELQLIPTIDAQTLNIFTNRSSSGGLVLSITTTGTEVRVGGVAFTQLGLESLVYDEPITTLNRPLYYKIQFIANDGSSNVLLRLLDRNDTVLDSRTTTTTPSLIDSDIHVATNLASNGNPSTANGNGMILFDYKINTIDSSFDFVANLLDLPMSEPIITIPHSYYSKVGGHVATLINGSAANFGRQSQYHDLIANGFGLIGNNLFNNTRFESNINNVILTDGNGSSTTLSHETTAPITGSGSLRVTATVTGEARPILRFILTGQISIGETYVVVWKSRVISGNPQFYGIGNLGSPTQILEPLEGTQNHRNDIVANQNENQMLLYIDSVANPGAFDVLIDDVFVYLKSTEYPITKHATNNTDALGNTLTHPQDGTTFLNAGSTQLQAPQAPELIQADEGRNIFFQPDGTLKPSSFVFTEANQFNNNQLFVGNKNFNNGILTPISFHNEPLVRAQLDTEKVVRNAVDPNSSLLPQIDISLTADRTSATNVEYTVLWESATALTSDLNVRATIGNANGAGSTTSPVATILSGTTSISVSVDQTVASSLGAFTATLAEFPSIEYDATILTATVNVPMFGPQVSINIVPSRISTSVNYEITTTVNDPSLTGNLSIELAMSNPYGSGGSDTFPIEFDASASPNVENFSSGSTNNDAFTATYVANIITSPAFTLEVTPATLEVPAFVAPTPPGFNVSISASRINPTRINFAITVNRIAGSQAAATVRFRLSNANGAGLNPIASGTVSEGSVGSSFSHFEDTANSNSYNVSVSEIPSPDYDLTILTSTVTVPST